jgi:hypothetical protein
MNPDRIGSAFESWLQEEGIEVEVALKAQQQLTELEPADSWSVEFLAVLGAWDEDIPRPPG